MDQLHPSRLHSARNEGRPALRGSDISDISDSDRARTAPRPPEVSGQPRVVWSEVWSCINPHAQYLAKQTVLNSEQGPNSESLRQKLGLCSDNDAGYECWQKIAALTQSGVATFPVHVCVAGAADSRRPVRNAPPGGPSGTVCKWEALPGGLHEPPA